MHVITPLWVAHEGYSIWSLDIEPSGHRFATGGGDNRLKIWNLSPIISKDDETNEKVPKLLCTVEHAGPVNCVRWSPNGMFIASAADDRIVNIWKLTSTAPSQLFGSKEKNHETWERVLSFKGHTADIADICWSPDSTKIASCALDNLILIYDVLSGKSHPIAELRGHESWVRGIAWDPIGRFISSYGEDKTVRIWRTGDWQEDTVIRKPFTKASSCAHFQRMTWSPDGSCLVATGANNCGTNTAVVLSRGTWKVQADFVGHRKPVVSSRFNPRLFKDKDTGSIYSVCAIGSADCSISIWASSKGTPLLVIKDAFSSSVVDFSWSKDGFILGVCSVDGKAIFLQFTEGELGELMNQDEVNEEIRKQYGDILSASSSMLSLVENPDQLQLENESISYSNNFITSNNLLINNPPSIISGTPVSSISSSSSSTITVAPAQLSKQTITVLPNGRKRITPMSLTPIPQQQPLFTPLTSTASNGILSSSSTAAPSLTIPTMAPTTVPTTATPSNGPTFTSTPTSASALASIRPTSLPPTINKTTPKPISITDIDEIDDKDKPQKRKAEEMEDEASSSPKKSKGKEKSTTSTTTTTTSSTTKTTSKQSSKSKEKSTHEKKKKDSDSTAVSSSSMISGTGATGGTLIRGARLKAQETSDKLISQFKYKPIIAGPEQQVTIESNYIDGISSINCHTTEKVLWETRIRSRVTNIIGTSKFVSIGCGYDGSIYLYSSLSGILLFPSFIIGDGIAYMESDGQNNLVVISCSGDLILWDITAKSKIFSTSILPIMLSTLQSQSSNHELSIKRVRLTPGGSDGVTPGVIVTMSNLYSYYYIKSMEIWSRVADDKFSNSEFSSSLTYPAKGPLADLQIQMGISNRSFLPGVGGISGHRNMDTVSHIEHQLASSLIIGSSTEYKIWLEHYIRRLTTDANEVKLRELCNQLLGPPIKSSEWNSSDSKILGLDKRQLLNQSLPLMSQNRALQRVVNEYREALSTLS